MSTQVQARRPSRILPGCGSLRGSAGILGSGWITGVLFSALAVAQDAYLVKDIDGTPAGSYPNGLTPFGDRVFFAAWDSEHGSELWLTGGTEAGTLLVRDIYAGPESSAPWYLAAAGDRLFFGAEDGEHGRELWVSDGTEQGTFLVKDIVPGPEGSRPKQMTAAGDKVFFFVEDPEHGWEPWVSDGTEAGTFLLRDIYPGPQASIHAAPWLIAAPGRRLFFAAEDPEHGRELWVSDGTPEGTRLVRDIWPGSQGSNARDLAAAGGRIFFSASDPERGGELWTSDGTEEGTVLVKDIRPGLESSGPTGITAAGDRVFFFTAHDQHMSELWVSDGTEAGTRFVKDLFPEALDPECRIVGATRGGRVYIFGFGERPQDELWISDGTEEGTGRVAEFPWQWGCHLASAAVAQEWLFFSAGYPDHGCELWVSNGTPGGTALAVDVNPEAAYDDGSSDPEGLVAVGDRLFFSADDGRRGRELWVLPNLSDQAFPMLRVQPEGCQAGHRFILDASASFSGEATKIVSYRWRLWTPGLFDYPQEFESEEPFLEYEYPEDAYARTEVTLTIRTDKGFERKTQKTFCRAIPFRRGDANADGEIDLSDPITILLYLFAEAKIPCERAADARTSGAVDISDSIWLLEYLFRDGLPPGSPFATCDLDEDFSPGPGCLSYPACPP